MPVHRVSLGDDDDTYVYVSDRTGDPIMKTNDSSRRWAYIGAIPHWLYFAPLRRRGSLWAQVVIWTSIAGSLMCVSGLVWGIWRASPSGRYRIKRVRSHSPYAGLMKWHHYAGLIFGIATFTWVFSGLLSMDPWEWSPGNSPTRQQRQGVSGGPLQLQPLTVARIQTAAQAISATFPPKELEVVQFQGEPFLAARHMGSAERRFVSAIAPERGTFAEFDRAVMLTAARAAMPGVKVEQTAWLKSYDAYYYDRHGVLPLPVLRVRFGDADRTLLYLDPHGGAVVQSEGRLSRTERWLYHGLHSLDFPFLYYRRPAWDIVVVVLSIGGLVISASTIRAAWHRLRRHVHHAIRRSRATRT
jgi:hypothetical protein